MGWPSSNGNPIKICVELLKSRIYKESRAKDCFEIEELRIICREEKERAWQLRTHELCAQKKDEASTVESVLVRFKTQDLKDKVNMVRLWYQPHPAKFLAVRDCRAAEYSEYLGISRISRVIFFGTIATPLCVHILHCSDAGEDWSLCVLLHGPILIFCRKSVRFRQARRPLYQYAARLCTPKPSVRFCQTYYWAMCSDLLWHHCLLPPHDVKDDAVFFYFLFKEFEDPETASSSGMS